MEQLNEEVRFVLSELDASINTYAPTDLEFSINGNSWRSVYLAIAGAVGWYELDITGEVSSVNGDFRPLQFANDIQVRVKDASKGGIQIHVRVNGYVSLRTSIQSIRAF